MRKNIILIGFSFTGKSSVAKLVGERLGWQCIDLDAEIVKKTGRPIREMFAREGEKVFRAYESRALKESLEKEDQVVATGGGAVISEENRRLMARSGFVVCLEARPETIYGRLLKDARESSSPEERPLLFGEKPLVNIKELKEKRRSFYAVAHVTIQTDDLTPEQVAAEVVRAWEARGNGFPG